MYGETQPTGLYLQETVPKYRASQPNTVALEVKRGAGLQADVLHESLGRRLVFHPATPPEFSGV